MSIKRKAEENVVLWTLGILLVGFLGGIATYKTIIEIANLEVVPKSELNQLEERAESEEPDREPGPVNPLLVKFQGNGADSCLSVCSDENADPIRVDDGGQVMCVANTDNKAIGFVWGKRCVVVEGRKDARTNDFWCGCVARDF